MVHRLVVSYGQPEDPAAFDAYYRDTHAPLALAQPGARPVHLRAPPVAGPVAGRPRTWWPSSTSTPSRRWGSRCRRRRAARPARTSRNFATGGATFVHFDVQQAS